MITRLTETWEAAQRGFAARDLSGLDYVYLWADGIHVNTHLQEHKLCLLVMIGVQAEGARSLSRWPTATASRPGPGQRCWFHKIADVLRALPKSAHPGARKALAEIWTAEDRRHALDAVTRFKAAYGAKFGKAAAKITDDIEELLAFYDFPAEHWVHLRTTNPIESTFATVRPEARSPRVRFAGGWAGNGVQAHRGRPGLLAGGQRPASRRARPRRRHVRGRQARRTTRRTPTTRSRLKIFIHRCMRP